jgi:hypothetical protein
MGCSIVKGPPSYSLEEKTANLHATVIIIKWMCNLC